MSDTPLVEGATDRVTQAIERFGKSTMAAKAELPESSIRLAGREGWNPTRETLRKLEIAAFELEKEHGNAKAKARTEHRGKNPGAKARAQ